MRTDKRVVAKVEAARVKPGPLLATGALILGLAVVALTLTAINMFGGFAVTRRMLAMFRK